MQSRSHTCGELRISDCGKNVTLVGWYETIRRVSKNLAFIMVRDFYGETQVMINKEEIINLIENINKESTILVEGSVQERFSKNSSIATGDVEIIPDRIEVLGECIYNALPFEIRQSHMADESLRLKYRYLDLRNPKMKKKYTVKKFDYNEIARKDA